MMCFPSSFKNSAINLKNCNNLNSYTYYICSVFYSSFEQFSLYCCRTLYPFIVTLRALLQFFFFPFSIADFIRFSNFFYVILINCFGSSLVSVSGASNLSNLLCNLFNFFLSSFLYLKSLINSVYNSAPGLGKIFLKQSKRIFGISAQELLSILFIFSASIKYLLNIHINKTNEFTWPVVLQNVDTNICNIFIVCDLICSIFSYAFGTPQIKFSIPSVTSWIFKILSIKSTLKHGWPLFSGIQISKSSISLSMEPQG